MLLGIVRGLKSSKHLTQVSVTVPWSIWGYDCGGHVIMMLQYV